MSESEINVVAVAIGKAAGKIKYLLLNKDDSHLCDKFCFEPQVIVDSNGNGADIFVWAYDSCSGQEKGRYVHNIIWKLHNGSIVEDMKVVHKNGVGVDCRLENLTLVPDCNQSRPPRDSSTYVNIETGVYWRALQHVVVNPVFELTSTECRGYFNRDGEPLNSDACVVFYECHYTPCTKMERHLRQFDVCRRCQSARYCSSACQQRDWSTHRKFCRLSQRRRERNDDSKLFIDR